jgi:hypothetical protein
MKLPAVVYSQLGPVPVRVDPELNREAEPSEELFGRFNKASRAIAINGTSCHHAQLGTLMHEIAHVAMWDAGTDNILSEAQSEAVCDAIGTYLAAAVVAGYVRLTVPRR